MVVRSNVDTVRAKIRQATKIAVIRGAESVLEEATSMIMDGEKTGRTYRRRGVEHQASAPGQAPASDTGRLVQSGRTGYDQSENSGNIFSAKVQWSTDSARRLEFGTENMEARPFARPALGARKDAIEKDILTEVIKALRW